MWVFNFFLAERTLKQEWQKGPRGIFPSCPLPPPGYPTYPSYFSSSSSSSSFFYSSSSSFSSFLRSLRRPTDPPSYHSGTSRTGSGMSKFRPGLLLPQGSHIMKSLKLLPSYKIVTGITRILLADPDKARSCSTNTFVINWFSHSSFVKIYLRHCHALMVQDGASSHKIDYFTILRRFKILKGIKIVLLVQDLRWFCWTGGFCLLVEHQRWRVCVERGYPV